MNSAQPTRRNYVRSLRSPSPSPQGEGTPAFAVQIHGESPRFLACIGTMNLRPRKKSESRDLLRYTVAAGGITALSCVSSIQHAPQAFEGLDSYESGGPVHGEPRCPLDDLHIHRRIR